MVAILGITKRRIIVAAPWVLVAVGAFLLWKSEQRVTDERALKALYLDALRPDRLSGSADVERLDELCARAHRGISERFAERNDLAAAAYEGIADAMFAVRNYRWAADFYYWASRFGQDPWGMLSERNLRAAMRCGRAGLEIGQVHGSWRKLEWAAHCLVDEFGPEHPATAEAQTHVARCLLLNRNLPSAEEAYRDAERRLTKAHGTSSLPVLDVRRRLVHVLRLRGKLEEASELAEATYSRWIAARAEDHPDSIDLLLERSIITAQRGDKPSARELIGKAVRLFDSAIQPRDMTHDVASLWVRMAEAELACGLAVEAELRCRAVCKKLANLRRRTRWPAGVMRLGHPKTYLESVESIADLQTTRTGAPSESDGVGPATLVGALELEAILVRVHALRAVFKFEEAATQMRNLITAADSDLRQRWIDEGLALETAEAAAKLGRFEAAEALLLVLRRDPEAWFDGSRKKRARTALNALVKLYKAWDKPEKLKRCTEHLEKLKTE